MIFIVKNCYYYTLLYNNYKMYNKLTLVSEKEKKNVVL